jgi:hypothetical protein
VGQTFYRLRSEWIVAQFLHALDRGGGVDGILAILENDPAGKRGIRGYQAPGLKADIPVNVDEYFTIMWCSGDGFGDGNSAEPVALLMLEDR